MTLSIDYIGMTNTNNTFFEWMDNMIITLDFKSDTSEKSSRMTGALYHYNDKARLLVNH